MQKWSTRDLVRAVEDEMERKGRRIKVHETTSRTQETKSHAGCKTEQGRV